MKIIIIIIIIIILILTECPKMLIISEQIARPMQNWRVEVTVWEENLAGLKMLRGIFQGDS